MCLIGGLSMIIDDFVVQILSLGTCIKFEVPPSTTTKNQGWILMPPMHGAHPSRPLKIARQTPHSHMHGEDIMDALQAFDDDESDLTGNLGKPRSHDHALKHLPLGCNLAILHMQR